MKGLQCPLCRDLYEDPVVAGDGLSYCARCIEKWFRMQGSLAGQDTDMPAVNVPKSLRSLRTQATLPNLALREVLRSYVELCTNQPSSAPSSRVDPCLARHVGHVPVPEELRKLRLEVRRLKTEQARNVSAELVRFCTAVDAKDHELRRIGPELVRLRAGLADGSCENLNLSAEVVRLQCALDAKAQALARAHNDAQRERCAKSAERADIARLTSQLDGAADALQSAHLQRQQVAAAPRGGECSQDVARLCAALDDRDEELARARQQIAVLRAGGGSQEALRGEVERLCLALDERDAELDAARSRAASLMSSDASQLRQAELAAGEHRQELQLARSEVGVLRRSLNRLENAQPPAESGEEVRLRRALEAQGLELDRARGDLAASRERACSAEAEAAGAWRELLALRRSAQAAERSDGREALASADVALRTVRMELREAQSEAQVERRRSQCDDASRSELNQRILDQQTVIDRLCEAAAASRRSYHLERSVPVSAAQQNSAAEMAQLRRELHQKNSEMRTLSIQKAALLQELEVVTSQLHNVRGGLVNKDVVRGVGERSAGKQNEIAW